MPNSTEFLTLLFADDTTFTISGVNISNLFQKANIELEKTSKWFQSNKLTLNVKKTKCMLFSEKTVNLEPNHLIIGVKFVEQVGTNCKQNTLNLSVMYLMTKPHGKVI